MKVRIKSLGLPKAAYGQQANYGLSLNGSGNAGSMQSNEFAMKSGLKPKRTIGGVPREEANLEAEGGETVVGQISGDGIVDHMTIKGPRHSSGGVPMNLPDDSFIFSDTKSMKIKDPKILQMFGKSKGSYTPAELAKPYDISKYKAILMDPDTDRLSRNTAEIMIKNIVMKLGALALAQEAKKGFPQGIPEIAKPYMEANGITEEDLMPELKAQAEQMQAMQQQQAMQMQQAQGMQQPQMQQQGPPQGMPQMMPDGQPAAMPQQSMAPPQQPMMDPRQMMAMQQEQQMMPPQPQQGMPMADKGIIASQYPMTEAEATRGATSVTPFTGPYSPGHYSVMDVARQNLTGPSGLSLAQKIALQQQQEAAFQIAQPRPRYDDYRHDYRTKVQTQAAALEEQSYGGTSMADYGIIAGQYPMTEEEAGWAESRQYYKDAMFTKDNGVFNEIFRDTGEQDKMAYGGTPMSVYGMQKFAPGGEPCPPGMYYHPTEGCIPFISPSPDTPDWTDDYKRSNRVIKSIQNAYNPSLNTPFLRQKYKDNNAEYPQEWNDENFIGPINEIDEDSLRRMQELQGYDIEKLMRKMEEVGMPPEFLPNMLDRMEEYVPKKFEEDPNAIRFHDSKNDPKKEILDKLNQEYEESVKDCPCRQRVIVQGVEKEKCVPCESQGMAAYGMQLGGYDMPFVMGTGGMMRYHNGGTGPGHPHGDETVDGREATKVETLPEDGTSTVTDQSGYDAKTIEERIAAEKEREEAREAVPGGSTPSSGWEDSICDMIKNGATWEELTDPAVAPGGRTHLNPNSAAAKAIWERCKGDQSVFEESVIETDVYVVPVEDVTEGTCGCPDPEGGTNEDGTPKLINVQTKAALDLAEDEPCPDDYCEETTTITENPPNEITPLPLIPAVSFRRGVADPTKPALDIIGAGERNYLDYRTAVQNDQGALEKQIAAIKTMPGVSVGQKQAMIAQVQAQSKAPSIVTDVYNKNVATANELAKSDMALAANQQQLQAGIDGQYNQDLANAENQYTQNVNAARQYKVENAKDNMRMQMMMRSIDNASENFDALGNFTGGTPLQKQQYAACIAAGNSPAQCMAQVLGTAPVESETPAPSPVNEPPPVAPVARYGRIVNPYVMGSSVYPWSK